MHYVWIFKFLIQFIILFYMKMMMQRYFLLFICLFATIQLLFAQNNNCSQPIADFVFQQQRTRVAQPFNEAERLSRAIQVINMHCLSSVQVRSLAETFRDDDARLEFAKAAYLRVFDVANFYEVYNAFSYFSTVFRLHDFVLLQRGGLVSTPNNPSAPVINFPNLIYPNYEGYVGRRNCNLPMNPHEFNLMAQEIVSINVETTRLNRLNTVANNYCLSVEQAMKFSSLLDNEDNRFIFLKNAFNRIFDVGNYTQATQVFRNRPNQEQWLIYLRGQGINTNNPTGTQEPICEVTSDDFNDISNRIRNISFDSERLSTAKSILRIKKCFTTAQIMQLGKHFRFKNSTMDFVKFAYDFTIDVSEYYKVADIFTFSSDKEELMKFIETKR